MKKLSIKNALLYGVCAAMVVFYLIVLYLGQNPKVGIEYRMYYITNELTDWPGYGKLSYELGTVEYCVDNYDVNGEYVNYAVANRKGQGWDENDSNGSCNKDNVAYMYYIPKEAKKDATFSVSIKEYLGEEKTFVYAGEECIGSFDGEGVYEFSISQINKDELLVIRFETEGARFTMWQTMLS